MTGAVPRSDTVLAAWQALNDRQRAYLECAYQVDQERVAAAGDRRLSGAGCVTAMSGAAPRPC